MKITYIVETDNLEQMQEPNISSFIGGYPKIPINISLPKCELCGSEQTFFFQVAFPDNHPWSSKAMALFSCTSCAKKGYFIPEMLEGQLSGADIPKDFIHSYQRNFKLIVFESENGVIRNEYIQKIGYKEIKLQEMDDPDIYENKVGGNPSWLLEDEAPTTYNKTVQMFFIMQILENYRFDILQTAPGQATLGFGNEIEYSENNYYELFLGNNLYFFGTLHGEPQVYIITQI